MSEEYSASVQMTEPSRLLFYDDVTIFGGHEVMVLTALEHLVCTGQYKITFLYSPKNIRLDTELKKLQARFPDLSLERLNYTTQRLQFLRTLWAFAPKRRLRALLKGLRPDCLIVAQGEISISSLGVFAGVCEGILTISYIPLAHSRRQRGEKPFARIKDTILSLYYRKPHRFITISQSMCKMLRERGVKQPIDVVENGVDLSALRVIDKDQARAQIGVSRTGYLAAMCGRIEFKQKGHDLLLRALAERATEFTEWTFLIVGNGPDKPKLEAMIEKVGLGNLVRLVEWQEDLSLVYSAIDMLLLPSRFEGVPVTMLESIYYRLPIVASACDAMAEVLPAEWLFRVDDSRGLADVMLRTRSHTSDSLLECNRKLIETRFARERQQLEFARVLGQCIHSSGKGESIA